MKIPPLSVSIDAGRPYSLAATWKVSTTSKALVVLKAREATRSLELSSSMFNTSTSRPREINTWVVSACQHSFGRSAWNLRQELRGRLWGSGTTKPRLESTRQIVATDGTPWRDRDLRRL